MRTVVRDRAAVREHVDVTSVGAIRSRMRRSTTGANLPCWFALEVIDLEREAVLIARLVRRRREPAVIAARLVLRRRVCSVSRTRR